MDLSVVIPYHNEGVEFISTALVSIKESIDVKSYEIIVVDDGSDKVLELNDTSVKLLRHDTNRGVGAAFDTGVAYAKSENLFLMGSDIRFIKNKWASKMVEEINHHPKAFTCTLCVKLNKENLDIKERLKVGAHSGATIVMYHDKKSNPDVSESFRSIIQAKWLPAIKNRDVDSYEIPCILGAAYGVSKSWYNYVDGWAGHRLWGTLEPYISLKSWFFGGSCRVAPRIHTGHIFKTVGTHGTPQEVLIYNKMFMSMVLLDNPHKLFDFLVSNKRVVRGRRMFDDNMEYILQKKEEYFGKIVIDRNDYFKRWNIDLRGEEIVNELSKEYDGIYARPEYHYQKSYKKSPYLKVWEKILEYVDHDDSVIDIGCGPGQFMSMLCDHGIQKYLGYDFSHTALGTAKHIIMENEYENASVEYIDLMSSDLVYKDADIYVAVEVFEHLIDDMFALSKIQPGKKVVITVPNFLGGSHVRKFKTEAEVLERYSTELDCKEISTITHGTGKIFILYGIKY